MPRCARRATSGAAAPSSPAAGSPTRTRRRRPRAPPAWPRPCVRRSAGPTPACRRCRAPRRRRSARRPRIGANTAERAPTTIRASPRAIRSRSSRRSASPSEECRIATRSPNRWRKRPTVCGASAISGTSTIVPSPRSSAARAGLEVHLGLAAPGRPLEQDVLADPLVERRDDALDGRALVGRERLRLGLAGERLPLGGRGPLAARRAAHRARRARARAPGVDP